MSENDSAKPANVDTQRKIFNRLARNEVDVLITLGYKVENLGRCRRSEFLSSLSESDRAILRANCPDDNEMGD